jgi:hypothetical protein
MVNDGGEADPHSSDHIASECGSNGDATAAAVVAVVVVAAGFFSSPAVALRLRPAPTMKKLYRQL